MSKTTIIIIVVIVIVVIVALIFVLKPGAPASTDDLASISDLMKDPSNPRKDCRNICTSLTKWHGISKRGKAKRACESDCAKGVDVSKGHY